MGPARSSTRWTCRYPQVWSRASSAPTAPARPPPCECCLALVRPTAGDGRVFSLPLHSPASYLPRVGALIESPAFYPGLSGQRNLAVQATLGGHSLARVPVVLERVGLADRGGDRYRTYSLGMKQRLGIAGALLGDPTLLILAKRQTVWTRPASGTCAHWSARSRRTVRPC